MNNNDQITVIEKELWNIFTYYSIHNDPMKPETLKTSTFIKFAKDCQITPAINNNNESKRGILTIELEVMKYMNLKQNTSSYNLKRRESSGGNNQTMSFAEFVELLGILAPIVYPFCPITTMTTSTRQKQSEITMSNSWISSFYSITSIRRLLLENVLLLSNRRQQPQDDGVAILEVTNLFLNKSGLTRSLYSIFNHYANITATRQFHHHHHHHHSNRKMNDAFITPIRSPYNHNNDNYDSNNIDDSHIEYNNTSSSSSSSSSNVSMDYQSCMQFTLDFNIRSNPLLSLTTIQIGDIILRYLPLDSESLTLKGGLNFESFVQVLIILADVAFRDYKMSDDIASSSSSSAVTVTGMTHFDNNFNNNFTQSSSSSSSLSWSAYVLMIQTKALLLHMWKSVVTITDKEQNHHNIPPSHSSQRTTGSTLGQSINDHNSSSSRRSNSNSSHNHQLKFREHFLTMWKRDGFSEYMCPRHHK